MKKLAQDSLARQPQARQHCLVEVLDRSLGLLGRVGPSDKQRDGILGSFDGLFLSWQFKPSWAVNADSRLSGRAADPDPADQERFESVALAYTPRTPTGTGALFGCDAAVPGPA